MSDWTCRGHVKIPSYSGVPFCESCRSSQQGSPQKQQAWSNLSDWTHIFCIPFVYNLRLCCALRTELFHVTDEGGGQGGGALLNMSCGPPGVDTMSCVFIKPVAVTPPRRLPDLEDHSPETKCPWSKETTIQLIKTITALSDHQWISLS